MRCIVFLTTFILFYNLADAKFFERKIHDIDTEVDLKASSSWTTLGKTEEVSVKMLIATLSRSNYGRKVLRKAVNKAGSLEELTKIISSAETSICNTSLIRKFSKSDPEKVSYSEKVKITINQNLNVLDATIDLAHELTHYSYRTAFNPYKKEHSFADFVKNTIEERGGEVDAYIVECKVLQELAPSKERDSQCGKAKDPRTNKLSRYFAIREFYKVGNKYKEFMNDSEKYGLKQGDLKYLTDSSPSFISSAYQLSYPVAAIKEFESMMSSACNNDQRRLAIYQTKMKDNRSPASTSSKKLEKAYKVLENSYYSRCLNF